MIFLFVLLCQDTLHAYHGHLLGNKVGETLRGACVQCVIILDAFVCLVLRHAICLIFVLSYNADLELVGDQLQQGRER